MNFATDRVERAAAALDNIAARQAGDGVILTSGSALKIEPIRWLWPGWLARGKMHLLAGAPGQGKTTIALAFAAAVTAGGRWPDGTPCEPGNVLIYSGEDDPADTLAPRLLAAGADLSRIHFVTGTREDGELRSFDPATDVVKLAHAIQQLGGVDLLIIDPIVGAVTGDSHKNTETRRALQPLVDLAAGSDCALIGVSHFSKGGQGADPAMRVIGSVAFTAMARVVLVAAKVKSDDDAPTRLLARAKSNIGPDDGGFEYHLEQTEVADDIYASRVAWGKSVEGSARELLTDPDAGDDGDETADAVDMLRAELTADSWTPATEATRRLVALGFTKKQVRTAAGKLGVARKKGGYEAGWYWRLPGGAGAEPPEGAQGAQGAHVFERAPWAPSKEKGTFAGDPDLAPNGSSDAHAEAL